MAAPKEADIAEAIVDDLNSATWTLAFQAEWHWLTEFGLEDLTTRRVIVTPSNEEITGAVDNDKRAHGKFGYKMRLTYQAKVDATDRDKINAEARQVQDIHDRYFYNRKQLTAVTGYNSEPARCKDAKRIVTYDHDKLRQNGLFESILELDFEIWLKP